MWKVCENDVSFFPSFLKFTFSFQFPSPFFCFSCEFPSLLLISVSTSIFGFPYRGVHPVLLPGHAEVHVERDGKLLIINLNMQVILKSLFFFFHHPVNERIRQWPFTDIGDWPLANESSKIWLTSRKWMVAKWNKADNL